MAVDEQQKFKRQIRPQKIALVIYSLQRDGAEKVVSLLSQQFVKAGHQVDVIVFDGEQTEHPYAGQLVDLKLPSHKSGALLLKMLTLLRRMFALRRRYQRQQYDRIIAVMESAAFPSILTGYRTIVSNHCNPAIYFTPVEWLLARLLYPRARKVVMVAKQSEAGLRQRLALPNLHCIYNPLDFNALEQLAQEAPAVAMPGDYIIAVARLEAQKRLDRLLTAYAKSTLQHSLPLLILGEGSLRTQLQQQIDELGLRDKVLLPGNVANPFPNIKAARFLVLSSDHEGFPMVLIEALALGKPVISTDCATGPNEIIQPGVNGTLVPVEDVEALAAAMDELHSNTQQYQQFSQQAKPSVAHLAVAQVAAQWLEL